MYNNKFLKTPDILVAEGGIVPQRCPDPNIQNLWICCLHKKDFADVIKFINLELGRLAWAQSSSKFFKREEISQLCSEEQ